jgi:hypothetical protein
MSEQVTIAMLWDAMCRAHHHCEIWESINPRLASDRIVWEGGMRLLNKIESDPIIRKRLQELAATAAKEKR